MGNGKSLNSNHSNGQREEWCNRYSKSESARLGEMMGRKEGWTEVWEQEDCEEKKNGSTVTGWKHEIETNI